MTDVSRNRRRDSDTDVSSSRDGGKPPGELRADGSRWMWPFELTERIGEGGMGVVYRGRYVPKDIEVAVKMLPEDVTDPVVLKRFERELGILKSLKHKHIVGCFGGSLKNSDSRYYAMEIVKGGTLEEILRSRGQLDWQAVVEYAQQMAAALSAAHAEGVVHRDLKPANFLVTTDGQLKLADFGLAFINAKSRITRAGKTAGTVLYMSPEQIRGREVGPASDLYSLGCVLYEMLSGKPPFDGEAQAAILHAHVTAEPERLGSLVLDCPTELDRLVHELLAKDPADRPKSAGIVEARLKSIGLSVVSASRRDVVSTKSSNTPLQVPAGRTPPSGPAALPNVSIPKPSFSREVSIATVSAIAAAVLFALIAGWQWSAKNEALRFRDAIIASAESPGPSRLESIRLLGELGEGNDDVIDVIRRLLEDPTPQVRSAAATAAAAANANDMATVGLLRQLAQRDENAAVRAAASQAATSLSN